MTHHGRVTAMTPERINVGSRTNEGHQRLPNIANPGKVERLSLCLIVNLVLPRERSRLLTSVFIYILLLVHAIPCHQWTPVGAVLLDIRPFLRGNKKIEHGTQKDDQTPSLKLPLLRFFPHPPQRFVHWATDQRGKLSLFSHLPQTKCVLLIIKKYRSTKGMAK